MSTDRPQGQPGAARSPGITYQQLLDTDTHDVPVVLRLESPQVLRQRRRLDRPLHLTRVARARDHAAVGPRLAVRVPRGRDPRGRRLPRVPDRAVVVHRHPHCARHHPGVPERLSAPRSPAEGLRRPLLRDPVPVPWLRLDHRRATPGRAGQVGLRPCRGRTLLTAAVQGGRVGRVRVHQPRPRRRAVARLPGRDRRAVRRVGPGQPVQAGARRQGHSGQLEDHPGGVLRSVPRQRHAPSGHGLPRRHQQPGRRVGELRQGHHAGRNGQPAARLDTHRGRDDAGDDGRARRPELAGPHRAGPVDARGRRCRRVASVGARLRANGSTASRTPR